MAPRPLPSLERLNSLFYLCNTSPSGLRYKKAEPETKKEILQARQMETAIGA